MGQSPSRSAKKKNADLFSPIGAALASALKAAKKFREGSSQDGGRKGARDALQALIKAAQDSQPDLKDRLEPLYHLLANLDGLAAGRVDPMFRARRSPLGGAPQASAARWLLKEATAVSVSMLLDDVLFHPIGGAREEAANRYVERRLRKLGMRAISKSTIGNWRAEVMAHLPGGVGVPNKKNAKRLTLDQCDDNVRTYMKLWYMWQDMKGQKSAAAWVDEIFSDDFRSIVASATAK